MARDEAEVTEKGGVCNCEEQNKNNLRGNCEKCKIACSYESYAIYMYKKMCFLVPHREFKAVKEFDIFITINIHSNGYFRHQQAFFTLRRGYKRFRLY